MSGSAAKVHAVSRSEGDGVAVVRNCLQDCASLTCRLLRCSNAVPKERLLLRVSGHHSWCREGSGRSGPPEVPLLPRGPAKRDPVLTRKLLATFAAVRQQGHLVGHQPADDLFALPPDRRKTRSCDICLAFQGAAAPGHLHWDEPTQL